MSPGILDALAGRAPTSVQTAVRVGRVSVAPTTPSGTMLAVFDEIDNARTAIPVTGWHPAVRDDLSVVLPYTGDSVTVAFDAEQQARCVSWEMSA